MGEGGAEWWGQPPAHLPMGRACLPYTWFCPRALAPEQTLLTEAGDQWQRWLGSYQGFWDSLAWAPSGLSSACLPHSGDAISGFSGTFPSPG